MYGQFKSMVQCPREECQFLSITFDPFSVCSLPLVDNSRKHIEIVLLRDHIYSKKVNFTYSLEQDYTFQDKIGELQQLLGVGPEARLILYVASYTSCEAISLKELIDDVRKEYKYRTLFLRQLDDFEQPERDLKVMLGHVICNPYYSDESYRKNIVPFQLLYIDPALTNQQVYALVLKRYSKILESLGLPSDPLQLVES